VKHRLEIVEDGLLFANKYPADWAIHAYYPRIIELKPKDLLCVYRRASALYADDARSWVLRSTDNGKTWQDEGRLYDGSQDAKHYSYSVMNLTQMRDGQIVVTGHRFHRPTPTTPMYDDKTGGILPVEFVLHRSFDGCRTWTPPEVPTLPDRHIFPYDSITDLDNGAWLSAGDWEVIGAEKDPLKPHVMAVVSGDKGKTWKVLAPMAGAGRGSPKTFWHTRVNRLPDRRLIAYAWTGDETGQKMLTLHRIIGTPDATKWSAPEPTNLQGQTNRPVSMGGQNVAVVMSDRESKNPGIYVALSEDGGLRFDTDRWVQIWDAYGTDSIGVPRTDKYPSSHDNIAFGAPDAIRLSDGDIMASFWGSQRGQMVVRWARVRMV